MFRVIKSTNHLTHDKNIHALRDMLNSTDLTDGDRYQLEAALHALRQQKRNVLCTIVFACSRDIGHVASRYDVDLITHRGMELLMLGRIDESDANSKEILKMFEQYGSKCLLTEDYLYIANKGAQLC